MSEPLVTQSSAGIHHGFVAIEDLDLPRTVAEGLDRWPSAGLAVGVVQDGRLAWFHGHGVADVATGRPVTPDTVFRIASITKTFTAIAVMQLWEQGLVDLDAPASDYLRSIRLVPARAGLRPPTVRHLLTHTAGLGYWLRLSDLLRPGLGSGVTSPAPAPSVEDHYRRGLPVEVEPGTKWMYSNHGFAALGQIVEDVSGQALDGYLREHLFEPLGMASTDLARSDRVRPHLATGYVLRSRGLRAVADRDVPARGGGAAYSTTRDLARYVDALLHGGETAGGSVLEPETLAAMAQPHFQPDARVPGMGLGFMLGDEGGHRTVGHDGVLSGFLSQMSTAPDDGIGVVVLANTGGVDGRGAPDPLGTALLRQLLGLPADPLRRELPPHPEAWSRLCGWYGLDPGPVTNLFTRTFMGAGAEVLVRHGHLMLEPLTPIPSLRTGWRLYPDDPDDQDVFRIDFSALGKGTTRVAFSSGDPQDGPTGARLVMTGMVFRRRSDLRNPRPWAVGALATGAAALAVRRTLRRGPQA